MRERSRTDGFDLTDKVLGLHQRMTGRDNHLRRDQALATVCIGVGQGIAVVLERV